MAKDMALGMTLARIGNLIRPQLRCSFCRRGADEVACLVAGASAYICDACVTKCVTVLEQQGGMAPTAPDR